MSELQEDNPLLNQFGLPKFSAIKSEHLKKAVEQSISKCRETVERVCREHGHDATWDNAIAPMEEADDAFSKVWGVASHLSGVKDTPEYRKAYEECLPIVSAYSSWIGQYRPLFELMKTVEKDDSFGLLSTAQQRAIKNAIRDFVLSGVDLPSEKQHRYAEITAELSRLETTFANHVLDATRSYVLQVKDENDLHGLPYGVRSLAKSEAEKRNLDGWVFTLDFPSYRPFVTYAENRSLREQIYKAYQTRASELGERPEELDNTKIMEQILKLRHELALLLGFRSYADYSLATKMASSPEEVLSFLYDLADKSLNQGRREVEELRAYAKAHGVNDLKPWDLAYFSEKLRLEKYAYDSEALRRYFPVSKVISGLFECTHRLYKVSFRPHLGVDVWDPEVKFYDIYDEFGSCIGSFYLDLYAREGKRGGAWMDECMTRRYRRDGTLQLPVAYVECNFTPPVNGRESQLTHDEVVTVFHEFGHALNQLLTRIDVPDVSGINGVPWDAVELPSQFNENFAWQEQVLKFLSSEVGSGEPLPKEKLDALINAKNFESALAMLRQLEFAVFDMRIHLEYDEKRGARILDILKEVKQRMSVVPQYEDGRFANSFTHIFAGGYAAGYYSYKWAEVLAADAFMRFLDEGLFDSTAGDDFKNCILAVGGSVDAMKAYIAFRGRRPTTDALLELSGIEKS
ncbi:MAG TPA: oligopeptidase A [Succinivibrionaceae bacterium]|nr:oligopeptidase A [Succinivibrionaceae bacterium]